MKIKMQKHSRRKLKALELYKQWAKEYNPPISSSAAEIARRYINPLTNKPYTRQHVAEKIRQISTGLIKI